MNATSMVMEGAALHPAPDRSLPEAPRGDAAAPSLRAEAAAAAAPARSTVPTELARALDSAGILLVLLAVWASADLSRIPTGWDQFLTRPITVRHALLVGGFVLLWPRLLSLVGMYGPALPRVRDELLRMGAACSVGAALAFAFPLSRLDPAFRMEGALYFWVGAAAVTLATRAPFWQLASSARIRTPRRVLIVGSGPRAWRLRQEVEAQAGGEAIDLLGFVDSDDHLLSEKMNLPKLGTLEDLERLLMHQVVDEVLIALPIKSCYAQIQQSLEVCARVGVESKYLADAFRCSLARPRFEQSSTLPFMAMKVAHDDSRVLLKRLADFAAALAGIVVLLPVMLVVALVVRLDSPGPIIFAQERYGRGKRRFRMFKFRTMVPNAEALQAHLEEQNEAIGPVFKIRHDPRITRVGRFLRKTSLDELPQLFNVLLGHMSLVGPRPLPVRDVQLFDQAWFMRRFSVAPGITGLWQISGRSNLGFDDWVALDLKYIDEWSLGLDLQILARTLPAVVRGVGAA